MTNKYFFIEYSRRLAFIITSFCVGALSGYSQSPTAVPFASPTPVAEAQNKTDKAVAPKAKSRFQLAIEASQRSRQSERIKTLQTALDLMDAGKYEEAVKELTELSAREPDNADVYLNRGQAYVALGRLTDALMDAEKVFAFMPDASGPYILRGSIYYKQKKHSEAIEDYTKAINLNDSNQIPALMNRAMAYRAIEKFKEALADYDKVIALDADAEDAYIERANINCNNTYDYSAAIYDATAAYKLNPKNGIALLFRAFAFKNLGNWKASEYDYTQAFALGAGTANSYVNRGEIYEKLNKTDSAIADYRKALELDPNHANAKTALAAALAKQPSLK